MSPEQVATLRYFKSAEFKHPELVEFTVASFLDDLRGAFGSPLTLTSDARTVAENTAAPGSSPTSLHLLGRAFDLRWPGNEEVMHRFLDAYYKAKGWTPPVEDRPTELELVYSAKDKHVHFALFPNDRASRLIIAAE